MRWLALTGVNGFIGHNLVLDLLASPSNPYAPQVDRVLGIDLLDSEGRPTHQRACALPNYHYESGLDAVGTISKMTALWGELPLAVIHNGACSSTAVTDPEIFRVYNLESSQDLFCYCAQKELPLLYASSASVYGKGEAGFSDTLKANGRYHPLNLYGKSKHDFDRWVLQQATSPPSWYGMRYFNVFGPFEEHKAGQASIFTWGRKQILEKGVLRLFQSQRPDKPDGHQQRDFVAAEDVCRVTWKLLDLALNGHTTASKGSFVNIGRGEAVTWLDLGYALFQALGIPASFEFIPMPKSLVEHYQDFTEADLLTLRGLGIREQFTPLKEAFCHALFRESLFTKGDVQTRCS